LIPTGGYYSLQLYLIGQHLSDTWNYWRKEMADFVNGMIFKLPHEKAPDFVKGKISVKVDEFIKFAQENQDNGWLNIQLKVSKGGKAYAELDLWKPDGSANKNAEVPAQPEFDDDLGGIPF